jgi:predicted amidohydrolase YtcJ
MRIFRSLILLLTTTALISCSSVQNVDLIIHNAVIYTIDQEFTIAESVAISGGRFLATGSSRDILRRYSSENVIDLQGKFVYPGLIDPHCHFVGYGRNLAFADLTGSQSFQDIINILRSHHEKYPTEWIQGRGWDQNLWEVKQFPHHRELDEAFPDIPVLLTRIDGHAAIANSEALRIAGINSRTRISGGEVILESGQPTGILIDRAIYLVREKIPSSTLQDDIAGLKKAQADCFSVGLTSIGDAGLDKEIILLIDSLQRSGDLQMRIYAMLSPKEENFQAFMYNGPYKTDHMNIRSVKLFADGALGSRGAKLLEPYWDDNQNSGLLVETPEFMRKIASKALENGFQVNTHCIGDSAVRLVLAIYSELLGKANELRWRIEHAQIVHPSDMHLFGKYSIIPSIQTTHATSDMLWAINRLGQHRIKNAYAYKQLLDQNGWLPNGSDFPVEHINPFYGYYAAIARQNLQGYPDGGWQMENALSRQEALKAMTIWAAKAQFEENEKGSIEPGKFADFIVLDQDLLTVEKEIIPGIMVRATYSSGELVYSVEK